MCLTEIGGVTGDAHGEIGGLGGDCHGREGPVPVGGWEEGNPWRHVGEDCESQVAEPSINMGYLLDDLGGRAQCGASNLMGGRDSDLAGSK